MFTDRLELRAPTESDRAAFVSYFCDPAFMVFSMGVNTPEQANSRFDRMLENATHVSFAKQPVIERSSGTVLGYSGVDWFDFEGERRPEFGYRLIESARGKGYATEAGLAIVEVARQTFTGTIYAIIDPTNVPSQRVAAKLGFEYWKQAVIAGYLDNLYRLDLP